jgi:hypothetical protein
MAIVPVDPIAATPAETAEHAASLAHEKAAAEALIAALGTPATETPIQLINESVSLLETQAHHGDQAAIRELARRAKLTEEHAAEHNATVEPLAVPHSPAEPGVGKKLDESA